MNKKVKLLLIATGISLLVAIFSASYAYFTISTKTGNEETITSGVMALTLADGSKIEKNFMIPGEYIEKTFSVTNTGNVTAAYDIYLSEVVNTFVDKTDLVYELISNDGGYSTSGQIQAPSVSTKIVDAQSIAANNTTHSYTLRITFLNKNEPQDDNQGVSFSAKIQINQYEDIDSGELDDISDPDIRSIIEENIMMNPAFWAKKRETIQALKNSPNMPEELKQYLNIDEVEGNPLCNRTQLVERINDRVQLTNEQSNMILTRDKIRVSGSEIDLRVFDKNLDGVYLNGVKLFIFHPMSGTYDNIALVASNSDIIPFDIQDFNDYTNGDDFEGKKVSLVSNNYIPETTIEATSPYSTDINISPSLYVYCYEYLTRTIMSLDLNLYVMTSLECDQSNYSIIQGDYVLDEPIYSLSMFGKQYDDINSIINDFASTVNSLTENYEENYTIVMDGIRYEGVDGIFRINTLTYEEALNIANFDSDYYPPGYQFDWQVFNSARNKISLYY